ncbi:hypothetical protein [Bacillus cereus]|uniref:Uncharacterized protein n=1 Tax=Bacillus cereus HuA2-1 TaxID=1053201 RepID=J9B594_BACCE|nr:hypothetical protein [Bacillus cereus]EJV74131.1 hypothetical protein IG3_05953 [Bacillus cereus HuA2-1]
MNMRIIYQNEYGPNYKGNFQGSIFTSPIYFDFYDDQLQVYDDNQILYFQENNLTDSKTITPLDTIIVDDQGALIKNSTFSIQKNILELSINNVNYYFKYSFDFPPASIQFIQDNIVLSIPNLHLVLHINSQGDILWKYGEEKNPGDSKTLLFAPHFAILSLERNTYTITDTLNNRILEIGINDNQIDFYNNFSDEDDSVTHLFKPRTAKRNGDYLIIADTGNTRIICIKDNRVIWSIGDYLVENYSLKGQRSIEEIGSDQWLIADTLNNLIKIIDPTNKRLIRTYGQNILHWPRCATYINETNEIAVADGRNNRVVFFNRNEGEITRIISEVKYKSEVLKLLDPHHIHYNHNKKTMLITSSSSNDVIEINLFGTVLARYDNLYDPHAAIYFKDGVLISNTGENELILNTKHTQEKIKNFFIDGKESGFNKPRFCISYKDGILVADSANHRLLFLKKEETYWRAQELEAQYPDSQMIKNFYFSRWIFKNSKNNLLVSDTGNFRVVQFAIHNSLKENGI